MSESELIFVQFMEECAEVAQRISKGLRFGFDEIQDGQPFNNTQRLMGEFADLIGVYETLRDTGALPGIDRAAVQAKKEKVAYFAAYSAKLKAEKWLKEAEKLRKEVQCEVVNKVSHDLGFMDGMFIPAKSSDKCNECGGSGYGIYGQPADTPCIQCNIFEEDIECTPNTTKSFYQKLKKYLKLC